MWEFVPFGLRGTVVGKTDNQLIVLFDEQFLGAGKDMVKSQMYRCTRVFPSNVLNLTQLFTAMSKSNFECF